MMIVNIDILGIIKIKWSGICELNSDDNYIYYCEQESLRRNGVAVRDNKKDQNAVLGCSLKNHQVIYSFPWQTIQYNCNPSLCPDK